MLTQRFLSTTTGQKALLPVVVLEKIKALAGERGVDLNTCKVLSTRTYRIGEPRTGLTIIADVSGAYLYPEHTFNYNPPFLAT